MGKEYVGEGVNIYLHWSDDKYGPYGYQGWPHLGRHWFWRPSMCEGLCPQASGIRRSGASRALPCVPLGRDEISKKLCLKRRRKFCAGRHGLVRAANAHCHARHCRRCARVRTKIGKNRNRGRRIGTRAAGDSLREAGRPLLGRRGKKYCRCRSFSPSLFDFPVPLPVFQDVHPSFGAGAVLIQLNARP
jgi:hypothetical protein